MQPNVQQLQAIQAVHEFAHEIFGLLIVAALYMLIHETAKKWIAGMMWRWKSPYHAQEIILFDGKLARLKHLGWLSTSIDIYDIEDKHGESYITGGWTTMVSNDELSRSKIFRRLELIPDNVLKMYSIEQKNNSQSNNN